MNDAIIFSVPSPHENGYVWRWRCAKTDAESPKAFSLYHDCLVDAQEHGYRVELTRARGVTAPGGKHHRLA